MIYTNKPELNSFQG